MENLQYPIGHFKCPNEITKAQIDEWIQVLETLPKRLAILVGNLTHEQLETPYRPQGWSVRQVIHHIGDSHHNSYTRFKWALTEDKPVIKAYEEKEWSQLFDSKNAPIELSLNYITALHAKLVHLLKGLDDVDLTREYIHPDGNVAVSVAENIGKYAWHSNHHFAHIEGLLRRKNWL